MTDPIQMQLFDRCSQGNRLAQMQVYNTYAHAMYNVAFRILKDTAEAEDAMQEGLITAFQKMDSWNRESTFGAWLKRIVINNSIQRLRIKGRLKVVTMHDNVYAETADEVDLDLMDYPELAQKVIHAMQDMNERYKQILNLHLIEGMDNEEIGLIMEISSSMCRTTLSRAKDQLRAKLIL